MSSTNPPPDLSTAMSTLAVSAPGNPSTAVAQRRLAPHRKYAQKFLTLPDELLTNISENVTPEDLPNFRLTCKTLANIAAKHFGQKRLAHRRFVITQYGLQGLIDMTAHPVFGPCVKSILFGTDRLTNELEVLMSSLESHKITDPTEAMCILQLHRERCNERSTFWQAPAFRMLVTALTNLSSHGNDVTLGLFNDQRGVHRDGILMKGYGSSHAYGGLPFTKLVSCDRPSLPSILAACHSANLRPKFLEFDLAGQKEHSGISTTISKLLLRDGQIRSDFDACIREGSTDIRILSSCNSVEFEQRSSIDEEFSTAEYCRFELSWLGNPMVLALFAAPITHFRMKSCSMWSDDFIEVFRGFGGTLQVVELVDVAIWGEQNYITTLFPILHCLRDELHLQRLVLDDMRAMNKDFNDPGVTVATGRHWNGPQQIHEGLNVLTGFDEHGMDGDDLDDWFGSGIEYNEQELQGMDYSQYEGYMDYTDFLKHKASEESNLEWQKQRSEDYKRVRKAAKEAMARVEAGEFNT